MSRNENALYRTSDIYFAAYLCSVDIEMVTTEDDFGGDGKRKLVFVFKVPKANIDRLKSSFFGGSASVRVRKFVDNLKALKSMVYV